MDFIPVRVSTFRGDQSILFDVYVRLGEKYVKYVKSGDPFHGDRLKRLREKKVRKMFIEKPDEPKYRSYLEENLEMAYSMPPNQDIEKRAEVVSGLQEANAEEVYENLDSVEAYEQAKAGSSAYVDFLLKNSEAAKAVLSLSADEPSLAQHGVQISTLAIGLGQKLGFTDSDKSSLDDLALAGLLHDIGHLNQNYTWQKKLADFSPEELKSYKEHPTRAADLLDEKNLVSKRVVRIVREHHEYINGEGFPAGLLQKETDPLAVILSVCETYERMRSFEGLTAKEAMVQLTVKKVGHHPLTYIQSLQAVLKDIYKK